MDDTQTTLLIAESDEPLLEFLVEQFLADRFEVGGASTAEEARVKLAHRHPDLLVLGELGQPHAALALLRRIRSHGFDGLRVIVVGTDGSELAQLRAFREGCDDYLAKQSLSYPVLLARARALLRRANGGLVARRRIGALEIDARTREAMVARRPLALARMEFELLSYLAAQPTRVWTKEELLRAVWGFKAMGNTRTVDAHACRLRNKLARAGAPYLVVNVRGVGYRLSGSPVAALEDHELAGAAANGRAA